MPDLQVQLLGGFRINLAGQDVKGIQSERLVLLLSHLLIHSERPSSRKQLAFLFWPETSEEQARTNLRNLFHLLKKAFPEIDSFLDLEGQSIQWRDQTSLTVDAVQFKSVLKNAKNVRDDEERIHLLQEAISHYRGELLPSLYHDWVLLLREEFQQAYIAALTQLAKLLEDARRYEEAIEATNALIRADELNENAYLQCIRLHALNNDRAGALQVYHACATILRREFGVEPSREIKTFHEQLVGAETGKHAENGKERETEKIRLIGRKPEWNRLRDAWQASQKGKAQMVAILGEAGIGKTRLANELMQWIQRQGVRTAFAQCYPLEGNLPFAPIVTWLRAAGLREELDALEPLWKKELARLLPEFEESESANGQKWQRQRLFEALARGLIGSGSPRLLILDDIQWSDQETLEFLHYLLRYDGSAKILALATVRHEEVDERHPLHQLRNDLQARGQIHEIELGPLNVNEIGLLARDLLGKELNSDTEARIFAETEGNPFFTVEILRSGVYETSRAMPSTLRSVLTRRLGQLSPTARDLVGLAATIGREFNFSLLAAVSQTDENALVQALDELWARRIIQIQQGDTYIFSHGKLQDAAYDSISAARRPILHRRVAESLYARDAESALIANHFEKAGQYQLALEQYLKAADESRRVFANHEAITHLQRVLNLLKEKLEIKNDIQKRISWETFEALGDLAEMVNNAPLMFQSYESALSYIPPGEALHRARILGKYGKVASYEGEYERGTELFSQALEALGDPSDQKEKEWWRIWLKIQLDRVWIEYDIGNIKGVQETLDVIQSNLNRIEDTDQLAEYYFLVPTLSFRRDGYQADASVLASTKLALELSQKGKNLELQSRTNFGFGFANYLLGNNDAALHYMREGLRLAEQIGHLEQQSFCLTYLAATYRRAGDIENCTKFSEISLALCEREGFKSFAAAAQANLGWIAWKQNNLKQARLLSEKAALGWNKHYPFWWFGLWTLIDLSLLTLRTEDAVNYARKLKTPGQQVFAKEVDDLLTGAIAAAEMGAMKQAETLLLKSVDWAKKNHYL